MNELVHQACEFLGDKCLYASCCDVVHRAWQASLHGWADHTNSAVKLSVHATAAMQLAAAACELCHRAHRAQTAGIHCVLRQ